MKNNFYKVVDLPKIHLSGADYIPPRTRNQDEAERRRAMPSGTLLLEKQAEGLRNADKLLAMLDSNDIDGVNYASELIAIGGLNAAWYTMARDADVMRRALRLPILKSPDETYVARDELLATARYGLFSAATFAEQLAVRSSERRLTGRDVERFGRELGTTSLRLACVPIANNIAYVRPTDAQEMAREQSLRMLDISQSLVDEIGVNPSIAQFADRDSGLMLELRRTAPDGVYNAAEQLI